MTVQDLQACLNETKPPDGVTGLVEALWRDAKGDWSRAHEIAQDIDTPEAAWVHAYLHRKEGDASNAGYWYQRAGKPPSRLSLEAEWHQIVNALLEK
ncbi:MAG: hypothetical protein ACLPYS_02755 [Vulcanimicrobiaceae bacterium]|jgi:hypothetical protein